MGVFEDLLATLQAQGEKIDALAGEVRQLRAKIEPAREVYTLADLAELPESPSLKSLRNHPERQPNGGVADGYRGQAKCWLRPTVEAWRRELQPAPADAPRLRVVGGRS